MTASAFPEISFTGRLRPAQQAVVDVARRRLREGARSLYVVAPPGAGKTVVGLFVWSQCVRRPALVLSPNSAIQAQWLRRIDLFRQEGPHDAAAMVSAELAAPALLTSVTYQAICVTAAATPSLDDAATRLWAATMLEAGQASDEEEAAAWIADLKAHNPEHYARRVATYRTKARSAAAESGGGALQFIHAGAVERLRRLAESGLGLLVLDECHHLLGQWGRVLDEARSLFPGVVTLGLTATPPDTEDRPAEDVSRYVRLLGAIDYETPTPAVVKDGFLAPYQDLVYFVRPSPAELEYVAQTDRRFDELIAELSAPRVLPADASTGAAPSLLDWTESALRDLRVGGAPAKDFAALERRDPAFATAARWLLVAQGRELPEGVPRLSSLDPAERSMELWTPLLDRYVRHALLRSSSKEDHALAERVASRLRGFGVQLTDAGPRACASPVSRVLACSSQKAAALPTILNAEAAVLGDRLRAVIVADFEKTSAISDDIRGVLDEEAGGAVAAFRALLADPDADALDPVLVTGSSVLVDGDAADRFLGACGEWLKSHPHDATLESVREGEFAVIRGTGSDWAPRLYVQMITDLFQSGVTRCLVGTRGLLGEGWDSERVNVLIDLTTATTSMTVNQLRGRSIRLDPRDPRKVANNWDVVCLAPEFSMGLADYRRFLSKHATLYGVTDDGAIEKGVGHVHPAFTEIGVEDVEGASGVLNEEMLRRASRREQVQALWRVGEPFRGLPLAAVEVHESIAHGGGFPAFRGGGEPWAAESLTLALSAVLLHAMRETGDLPNDSTLRAASRGGGYVRAFLESADGQASRRFADALAVLLGPLDRPRYVMPRIVVQRSSTWISRLLPQVVGRYFEREKRQMVMLHAVPSPLDRNRETVAVFENQWHRYVGPGEALYAHRGEGREVYERARQRGLEPSSRLHLREIFL